MDHSSSWIIIRVWDYHSRPTTSKVAQNLAHVRIREIEESEEESEGGFSTLSTLCDLHVTQILRDLASSDGGGYKRFRLLWHSLCCGVVDIYKKILWHCSLLPLT